MNRHYQQKVITTPFGQNVGRTILNNLKETGLLHRIEVKTINTVLDTVNKSKVTTLEFSLQN